MARPHHRLGLTQARAAMHIHLGRTVSQTRRQSGLSQAVCPYLQLLWASRSLGLAQDTRKRSRAISALLRTPAPGKLPLPRPAESCPPTRGLENPALLLPSKVRLLSLIRLYTLPI